MGEPIHRFIETNAITMHVVEQGEGPAVVLCHGFPELWYSWRHQIGALADAGYRVIVPDQRGYGQTDSPASIDDYDIIHLTDDMVGLLDALDEPDAVFVGHDWGAPVVWALAQRAPERVRAVAGLSVPFVSRGERDPISVMEFLFEDRFFYILYFQEPGVADAELAADVEDTLRRTYRATSSSATSDGLRVLAREGTGWRGWLPPSPTLPAWMREEDLAYYVGEFERTGFSGGLNWYRNIRRNWELSATYANATITMPALFVAGEHDIVNQFMSDADMAHWLTDLRASITMPATGHWIQQERSGEVNEILLDFLSSLD